MKVHSRPAADRGSTAAVTNVANKNPLQITAGAHAARDRFNLDCAVTAGPSAKAQESDTAIHFAQSAAG